MGLEPLNTKRIRFRVKGKSRGKQHFSGLTLTSQLDRVEAWPVELRNSTGWSSRRSSWSSRWLLPSSFAYPVELLPCAKSLHAPYVPYAPECSKRPISKDQTCICLLEHLEHWDVRSKEGLGAWTQLNWIRKGEEGSHLEVSSTHPTRPAKFNSIELRSQTRKMLLPP
ncbi:unnamed protein product [Microthlaspi erraticum]|uniref:Uncharacterized protein n=1 Tax=Microthlaspi erraticum TaxID=1685480 RepID=A0A6D2K007_9BRAS|nr:unnamed protein product [Microthlaspi erraticum]